MKNIKTYESIFDDISYREWNPTEEEMRDLLQHFQDVFDYSNIQLEHLTAGDSPSFIFKFGQIHKCPQTEKAEARRCVMLVQKNSMLLLTGQEPSINRWNVIPSKGDKKTKEHFNTWVEAVSPLEIIIYEWYNYKERIEDYMKKINDLYDESDWNLGDKLPAYKVIRPY